MYYVCILYGSLHKLINYPQYTVVEHIQILSFNIYLLMQLSPSYLLTSSGLLAVQSTQETPHSQPSLG